MIMMKTVVAVVVVVVAVVVVPAVVVVVVVVAVVAVSDIHTNLTQASTWPAGRSAGRRVSHMCV